MDWNRLQHTNPYLYHQYKMARSMLQWMSSLWFMIPLFVAVLVGCPLAAYLIGG